MGLTNKTSEKAAIHHLGSHHISWRSICYCCSQECTIINSEAIHLINCRLGVFIYPLHDYWLYHNFADISPPKYIRWKANFKLLNDLFRCFYGVFRLGLQSKVLVRLLLRNIFQKQYKMYNKSQTNSKMNN